MSNQGFDFDDETSLIYHIFTDDIKAELKDYLSPEIANSLILHFREEFKNWRKIRYAEHINAGRKIGHYINDNFRNFRDFQSVCIVDVGNVGGINNNQREVTRKLREMLSRQMPNDKTLFIFVSSLDYVKGWLEKKFSDEYKHHFLIKELQAFLKIFFNIENALTCSIIIPQITSYDVNKESKQYSNRNDPESFCAFREKPYLHATCGLDDLVMKALRCYFMYQLQLPAHIITDDENLNTEVSRDHVNEFLNDPFENIEVFDSYVFQSYDQYFTDYKMNPGPYDKVLDDLDFAESFNNEMQTRNLTYIKIVMPDYVGPFYVNFNDFVSKYSNPTFRNMFKVKKTALDRKKAQQKESLGDKIDTYNNFVGYNINYDLLEVARYHKNRILSKRQKIGELTNFISNDLENLKREFSRNGNTTTADRISEIQSEITNYLKECRQEMCLDFIDNFGNLMEDIYTKPKRDIGTEDITSLWEKIKKLTQNIELIHGLFQEMILTRKGYDFINYVIEKIQEDAEDEKIIPFLELEKRYFNLFMSPTFPNGFDVNFPDRHIQVDIARGIELLFDFYKKVPTIKEQNPSQRQKK